MSIGISTIPTPYIHVAVKRRKQTWYSIANGNWTDKNTWVSNSIRRFDFPQTGDDVYINDSVTCNASAVLNNLYISGNLLFDSTARTLTVNGDIQANGSVNMSNAAHNLILKGVNNNITNFTRGTTATITYSRFGDQDIMDLQYTNLTISGGAGTGSSLYYGTKKPTANLTTQGNLTVLTSTLQLGDNNLTVNGFLQNTQGQILKSGGGNVLIVGLLDMGFQAGHVLDFSVGNPTVELRGGISVVLDPAIIFKTGTSLWTFTTNSQSISGVGVMTSGVKTFDCPILISGAITISVASTMAMLYNNAINGNNASSTFSNKGNLYTSTPTLPMVVGVFDYKNTTTSLIGYIITSNHTLPFSNYEGLMIGGGTGVTVNLAGNTTIRRLQVGTVLAGLTNTNNNTTNATLQLSSFDISVTSTTSILGSSLLKSGAGNVLFGELLDMSANSTQTLDFSVGNPTVELRGGITFNTEGPVLKTGTGQWSFTTNNQSVSNAVINVSSPASTFIFDAPILISGAITLTVTQAASFVSNVVFKNNVTGNNASSTLDNRTTINYQYVIAPMLTGILQTNAAANTFLYNRAGDQDIKGGTYRTLTLAGSGIKTLQGNVVAATAYTLTAPATLNLNGFTRT